MEDNGRTLLKDHVRTQCRKARRYYDPEVNAARLDEPPDQGEEALVGDSFADPFISRL